MKFIINILKTRKFIQLSKKHFEPDKSFLKKSKALFLRQMAEKNGNFAKNQIPAFPFFPLSKTPAYAFASLAILFIMSTGAVAFAEQQNVGPENPLYKFKRMGEMAQIQFTTTENKPELHQKFAERRLKEIKEIKASLAKKNEEKQEIIKDLDNNLRENISAVSRAIDISQEMEIEEIDEPENENETTSTPEIIKPTKPLIKNGGVRRSESLCWQVMDVIEEREEIEDKNIKKESANGLRAVREKCSLLLEKNSILKLEKDENKLKINR